MQTPAHLIFGMAAFGKADRPVVTSAAFIGAMIPDLSLYLLTFWHMQVVGTDADVIFRELYYSPEWQSIFRIDNALVLWGIALGICFMLRNAVGIALCGAAILHIALDFPLHHDDGRAHFWPITDWIFASPVSYWDPAHYGNIVGPIEALCVFAACVFLWRRHINKWMRAFIVALGALQIVPFVMFAIMFS